MIGCIRHNNEDMALVGDRLIRDEACHTAFNTETTDRFLMAVADGMGGHASGEVASSDVLSNLQFFFSDIPASLSVGDFNEAIFEWLSSINALLESKSRAASAFMDMGTTLVGMAYYNKRFFTMNCGDSRLYRYSDRQLVQLTTDHSLNQLMGRKEHSNIIVNCIGGGCKNSYIDLEECTHNVCSGDRFLICSDGLTDMIDDEKIAALMADGADAQRLCAAAEEAGGADNVTAIVLDVND